MFKSLYEQQQWKVIKKETCISLYNFIKGFIFNLCVCVCVYLCVCVCLHKYAHALAVACRVEKRLPSSLELEL